jgi:dihydroflavonol-4-reductase
MKRILVTGATGFLGKHFLKALKSSEENVGLRILCRRPPREKPEAEVVIGDVSRPADVFTAAEGVSEIYHLAGIVSRNTRDQELLYRTHVEGTRSVCEAARRPGDAKVVVVSSSGTIAVSREPVAHNEESGYKNDVVARWPYYLSKIFAEKLALDYASRHSLPIVIVNPSLILGPGDERQSSTRDIVLFLDGQILAIPEGGLNFVDVRDAAAGLVAAMRCGRPGERYLLGGVNWTFRQLIENTARLSSRRPPRLQLPLRWSLLSARLLRQVFPLGGKQFRLDDESIRMASLFWYCDAAKARSELGFKARDPLVTLEDTIKDLRRNS